MMTTRLSGFDKMKPKQNYKPGGMDNCQTPPYAVTPLLPYLKGKTVWEPACGDGNLSYGMRLHGIFVYESDISTGYDFLTCPHGIYDAIVTNPPYSRKYEFIERCYELRMSWALLMPVETIGAARAQIQFERYGIEIMFLRPRINFKMPQKGWQASGSQFPVAWFCWNLLPEKIMYFDFKNCQEFINWQKQVKSM